MCWARIAKHLRLLIQTDLNILLFVTDQQISSNSTVLLMYVCMCIMFIAHPVTSAKEVMF